MWCEVWHLGKRMTRTKTEQEKTFQRRLTDRSLWQRRQGGACMRLAICIAVWLRLTSTQVFWTNLCICSIGAPARHLSLKLTP